MTAPVAQTNDQIRDTLINKLQQRGPELQKNADYYDATARPQSIGISTPPEMRQLLAQNGWGRMYVASLSERLFPEGFRVAGDDGANDTYQQWWDDNHMALQSGLGTTETFIHGISYVTISAPDKNDTSANPDSPVIRVESPFNFYADFDPITLRAKRGVRVYDDDQGQRVGATLMVENDTLIYSVNNGVWTLVQTIHHGLGRPPIVPLVNREVLSKPFGESEITPELRSSIDTACRIMMNMQGAAELMALPQRVLFGVDKGELPTDPDNPNNSALEAYYARIMAFESESGSATQFAAAELRNFTEVIDNIAKNVASYTGLPPQYLTIASENPASAEAIKASESRLVKKCERKCLIFGAAWAEVMRVAKLVMGQKITDADRRMEVIWRDPSTPTYVAMADGVQKLYAQGMGVIPLERARIDMGYSPEERAQMKEWDKENPTNQLSALVGPSGVSLPSPKPGDDQSGGQDAAKAGTNVPGRKTASAHGYGTPSRGGSS